jgi:hypothetical protein
MELWTKQHAVTLIPSVAVMIVLTLLLRCWLGDKTHKIRMIPIQIIAVVLLVLEAGKQGYSLYHGYDLYCLPFHFCSLFIFMLPAMAFYRGKYAQQVYAVTAALCASVFALMLIYPNLIYGSWNVDNYFKGYMDFHTVTFHNLVMLAFLLIPALRLHEPQPRGEVKAVLLFTVGFCVVSASMAHLLKTNYANYYTCNIPVLETVRLTVQEAVGALPAKLLYIAIVSALNVVFVYGSYWLYRLVRKWFAK